MREYADYAPYGLAIAASFLLFAHDSDKLFFEDFAAITPEDDEKNSFERGGETVNRELRALMTEMYDLHQRFGLEL